MEAVNVQMFLLALLWGALWGLVGAILVYLLMTLFGVADPDRRRWSSLFGVVVALLVIFSLLM